MHSANAQLVKIIPGQRLGQIVRQRHHHAALQPLVQLVNATIKRRRLNNLDRHILPVFGKLQNLDPGEHVMSLF